MYLKHFSCFYSAYNWVTKLSYFQHYKTKSIECLGNKASQYATTIKSELEKSLILTKVIASELARQHKSENNSRDGIDQLVRSVLTDNHDFVAFYIIWEKNKFDGKDSLYKKYELGI